jgi:tetratricopeptide (TPR) repeat protein
MTSIIPGYEYDIFISYRQKDNKYDGWVTEFVENLKKELEATFKETVTVFFDENPHDRLQETHHVSKSLEAKLKCVIFLPILSQTYCDPSSYAWQFELVPFNKMAADDQFGKEIKLRGGNYASRILPIRIHDMEPEDIELFQQETGSALRAMDFVFKTATGVNRPLRVHEDHPSDNLNKTFYRDQINKVAHAIKEIILGMRSGTQSTIKGENGHRIQAERVIEKFNFARKSKTGKISWQKILSGFFIAVALILAGLLVYPKLFQGDSVEMLRKKGQISLAVMPFQNLTRDSNRDFWEVMIQNNLINSLSAEKDLTVRQMQSVLTILESHDLTNYASITPAIARSVSQKLDANVSVQGSINQIGGITRLNAQLIDSKTDQVFKSFQLDGNPENIIQLADSLTILVKNFLITDLLKKEFSPTIKRYFDATATSTDPEVFRYYLEGMKSWNKREFAQAREMYFKALEIDPDFIPAMVYLIFAYGQQGLFQEAKKWSLVLYENRGKVSRLEKILIEAIYSRFLGTPTETIRYYRMLLDMDDLLSEAYHEIGVNYVRLNQYENAIPEFEKNLEILRKWGVGASYPFHYTELGNVYHKTGQFRKEQRLYKQAEKDFPDDIIIIRRQAILALVRGRTKQADEYLERFESIGRNLGASEASIQSELGYIYKEAGKLGEAEEYYRNALELEPQSPTRMNNLSYLLIEKELNVVDGMELIEKALELRPDNYTWLHTKGLGLFKQGKYTEALEILQKSWDLRMERAIYYHEAFLNLEKAKKAVANL